MQYAEIKTSCRRFIFVVDRYELLLNFCYLIVIAFAIKPGNLHAASLRDEPWFWRLDFLIVGFCVYVKGGHLRVAPRQFIQRCHFWRYNIRFDFSENFDVWCSCYEFVVETAFLIVCISFLFFQYFLQDGCLQVYRSLFQPVRRFTPVCGWQTRYGVVRMRKPCCGDDKHGADKNSQQVSASASATAIKQSAWGTSDNVSGENIYVSCLARFSGSQECLQGFSLRIVGN